jgi:hypothetical protein
LGLSRNKVTVGEPAVVTSFLRIADLPQYDLRITLDTLAHRADIQALVTWTNTTSQPTDQLVFSFYPAFKLPPGDYLHVAKMLEMLRLQPTLAIDKAGGHGVVHSARLISAAGRPLETPTALRYEFDADSSTTLRIALPFPVGPGESVGVELNCVIRLPNKQGRWGQWKDVTFLTNALPILAYRDEAGWQPKPFVPWAQPWFAEAGIYRATITLPEGELLATSAIVKSETPTVKGWKQIVTEPFIGRDFALLCSPRYREFRSEIRLPDGKPVVLKCIAFPEHEHYAQEILKIVGHAIPVYSSWFGNFPYSQFTIAESYFGWNGNECGGLVMIDERVFGMPHVGHGYVEYLVSHETCHQWWYNLVGTNGYSEPFMDEGAATYFTHRMLDEKHGKNNPFFEWPRELEWLPNVNRENYRYSGMFIAIRNNQMQPAAQDLPKYKHAFGLFTGAYDRGSKVFRMIEDRLGEAAFLDFYRQVVAKYSWRIFQVADMRRELEAYTGRDWGEFFEKWVYGTGLTDWSLEQVEVGNAGPFASRWLPLGVPTSEKRTSILLRQKREFTEPTTLGIRFPGQTGYPIRIPIGTGPGMIRMAIPVPDGAQGRDAEVTVEPSPDGSTVRVSFSSMIPPEQITVDPDGVLLDANPTNNTWKSPIRARLTPLYTMLDETDVTSDYDRLNITAGPWVWGASYADPWYTRSTMVGLRVGLNQPQQYKIGAYATYRTDFRDVVVGVDGAILGNMEETGFNYERRVAGPWFGQDGSSGPQRADVYQRWVIQQSSSLYLPPMIYHEVFATYQDNFLPYSRTTAPGAVRFDNFVDVGWHGRANLYTPYWNPASGVWGDLYASVGEAQLPGTFGNGQLQAQLAGVQELPDGLGPLSGSRIAGRIVGEAAFPGRGEFFALGGGTLFRGYDLAQRQGSMLWVANAEFRYPVVRDVEWDVLDHCAGARSLWLATFYDVGDVYANGHSVAGGVAHAVGAGLRMDIALFSFIERATLRFDFAKTINDATPFQFWFGVQHAF